MSMYVCLSACISQKHIAELRRIFVHVACNGVVTRYLLPVMWTTSRFHTVGSVVRHNMYFQATTQTRA